MRYSIVRGRDTIPTIPEGPPGRSGTRRAVRTTPEDEAMTRALEAERARIHQERQELDAKLEDIDAMIRPCVEAIDEDEEPTQVRRNVVELKRRLGIAPGSSKRPPASRPR